MPRNERMSHGCIESSNLPDSSEIIQKKKKKMDLELSVHSEDSETGQWYLSLYHKTRRERLTRCWHPTNACINRESVSGRQSTIISFSLAWLADDLDSPWDGSLKKIHFSRRFPPSSYEFHCLTVWPCPRMLFISQLLQLYMPLKHKIKKQ